MRLWIKAVLLTLWSIAKWAALTVLFYALLNALPTTVYTAFLFAFIAAALIALVAAPVFLFCAFVSDNHRRLEEQEKQRTNWDRPTKIDPDRGAVYTAGDGARYWIGSESSCKGTPRS